MFFLWYERTCGFRLFVVVTYISKKRIQTYIISLILLGFANNAWISGSTFASNKIFTVFVFRNISYEQLSTINEIAAVGRKESR